MPSLEAIEHAGPWVFVVFVLTAGFLGFVMAIKNRWLVPGWIYDRVAEDWRVLKDQGDRNAKTIEAMPQLVADVTEIRRLLERMDDGDRDRRPSRRG